MGLVHSGIEVCYNLRLHLNIFLAISQVKLINSGLMDVYINFMYAKSVNMKFRHIYKKRKTTRCYNAHK